MLKPAQGDDLKAPTTRINLALPPSFIPEAPRKITEEERGFEAAKTLRDAKFRARHEGQRKLRAAKVINSPRRPILPVTDDFFSCSGKRKRPTRRSKPSRALLVVYFPLFSLVLCISQNPSLHWWYQQRAGDDCMISRLTPRSFVLNNLYLESDDKQLACERDVNRYPKLRYLE